MASKIIFLAALAAAWAPPSFLREPRRALQTCPETTAIEERRGRRADKK